MSLILKSNTAQTRRIMCQRRWMQTLHEFDFEIKYRPNKKNLVTNALSKKASLLAISIISNPPLLAKVREKVRQDSFFNLIIITLLQHESKTPCD